MIPVFIPSMSRADQRLLRGPVSQLPEEARCYYVVPIDQHQSYEDQIVGRDIEAECLPCDERGIAATRLWIGHYALQRGWSKFVMMDDDIGFLVRKSAEVWNLRAAEISDTTEMMHWMEQALDEHAHVSISPREGNAHSGAGEKPLVGLNTRTLRVLAYRTDVFLAQEHCRVEVMEDFDISLQILESGHSIAASFWWSQGQRMTNEAGGCSTYRTHEVHEQSARRLAELHPGIVKLRQKQNKTDRDAFGTRLEVTIAWKKAYQQGQNARAR